MVAATFVALMLLPDRLPVLAVRRDHRAVNGVGSGLFSAPNTTTIMNSVAPRQRGAASGMRGTFFNAGSSLSIGLFFSLMIAGLAAVAADDADPRAWSRQGVDADRAAQVGNLPPVGSLFAAFLGVNPVATLLGPTGALDTLPAANAATLTGPQFFPHLIAEPFHSGLVVVFSAAAVMMVVGAAASMFGVSQSRVALGREAAGERLGEEDPELMGADHRWWRRQ